MKYRYKIQKKADGWWVYWQKRHWLRWIDTGAIFWRLNNLCEALENIAKRIKFKNITADIHIKNG